MQEKFVTAMRPFPILDRLSEEKPSRAFNEIFEKAPNKEAVLKEQWRNNFEVNKLQNLLYLKKKGLETQDVLMEIKNINFKYCLAYNIP